jgi:hypothetical protein
MKPSQKPLAITTATFEPVVLSVDDLVSRWRGQVKPSTLASWRSKGVGPRYLKLGGRVVYPLVAIEAYEQGCTKG